MNRLAKYKSGERFYVSLSHKGSKSFKNVGYIKGIKRLQSEIAEYVATRQEVKVVQVMFLRNIMDEDEWFEIPVSVSVDIKL